MVSLMISVGTSFCSECDQTVDWHHILERRRTWIYEVPMKLIHPLRETVNSIPDGQLLESSLAKYDPPVLAGAVKLWLLELEPPLGLYDAWDEFRKIYPSSKLYR